MLVVIRLGMTMLMLMPIFSTVIERYYQKDISPRMVLSEAYLSFTMITVLAMLPGNTRIYIRIE